jgi:hypothetical protein
MAIRTASALHAEMNPKRVKRDLAFAFNRLLPKSGYADLRAEDVVWAALDALPIDPYAATSAGRFFR